VVRGVIEEGRVSCIGIGISRCANEIQAEQWLEDLKQYIAKNPSVKGFPADDKQVFEL
jgi:hypothetical protein